MAEALQSGKYILFFFFKIEGKVEFFHKSVSWTEFQEKSFDHGSKCIYFKCQETLKWKNS